MGFQERTGSKTRRCEIPLPATSRQSPFAKLMNRIAVLLVLSGLIMTMRAQDEVKRPHILGVSHMALFVSDLQKARTFYQDFLGYAEPYALKRDDGSDRIAFIKINEDQYLELFAENPKQD